MAKFVKHIETGSFHEVEDDKATLAAYPGQYEVAKSGEAPKAKLGFGKPQVGKWADGTEADTTVAAAPATPVQTGVGEVSNAKVEVSKAKAPGPSVKAMQAKAATEAKAAPELQAPAPTPKVDPAK